MLGASRQQTAAAAATNGRAAWLSRGPCHLPCRSSTGAAPVWACSPTTTRMARTLTCRSASTSTAASTSTSEPPARGTPLSFSWTDNWYPVIPVGYLYKDRPQAFQLCGINMCVWWDGAAWACVEDACSHRLAPLSEGYICPDGSLMCSYHGWQFQADGKCTKVPQLENASRADMAARASSRACVKRFPCQVAWSLLWVWPSAGAAAEQRAAATPPNIPEPVRAPPPQGLKYFSSEAAWSCRETPLDLELLVENILDLSHVPFSHHGVAGNRPDAQPLSMTQVGEMTCEGGFVMSTTAADKGMERRGFKSGMLSFTPPNMVHYAIEQKGGYLYLTSYTTPCAPGKSRYFSRIYTSDQKAVPDALASILMRVPPWLIHLSTHKIVDADMILAAGQAQRLAERGVRSHLDRAFYMPAPADRAVVNFYKWLSVYSGGHVRYASHAQHAAAEQPVPSGAAVPTREALLDHYTQHTRYCKFCQEGLQVVGRVLAGACVLAAVALGAAVHAASRASPIAAVAATAKMMTARVCSLLGAAPADAAASAASAAAAAAGGWWSIVLAAVAGLCVLVALKAAATKQEFFRGNVTFHDLHIKA